MLGNSWQFQMYVYIAVIFFTGTSKVMGMM